MLTRWSDRYDWPFGDVRRSLSTFEQLRRRMDRAFSDFEREFGEFDSGVVPKLSLDDGGESFVVRAELPGFSEKDIEVTANANTLTLRGQRKDDAPEGYAVHRRERRALEFSRSFTLPSKVDPEKIQAVLKDGVLTLTLPKAAEARPKQITVRAG